MRLLIVLSTLLVYFLPWITFGAGVTLLVRSTFLGLLFMAFSVTLFTIRREYEKDRLRSRKDNQKSDRL